MSTTLESRVHAAVEATYRTFAVRRPASIEGCPCCIDTRKTDTLLSTPLRDLTGHDLWRYVSGVFLTVGGEGDFRYLLPRILDLAVGDPSSLPDIEVVLGKLALANWQAWDDRERGAIQELVDAWFDLAVARDQLDGEGWIGSEAESVLCGASRVGMPLRPMLLRLQDPSATLILADLKERHPAGLSPYWEYAPEGEGELLTFLSRGLA